MAIQGGKYGTLKQQQAAHNDPYYGTVGEKTATPAASGSSSPVSYDQAKANLAKGGLTGDTLRMAQDALGNSYASTTTQMNDPAKTDTTTGTTGPGSDYVPRYYPQDNTPPPQSEEQIQRQMQNDAQGQINSLRDYESSLVKDQQGLNDKADSSTRATNVLNGLSGSSEADLAQQTTSKKGNDAVASIRAGVETQVQDILSQIRKDAITESHAQVQDQATQLQNQAARQQLASESVKNLAASGATFDGLRKTDPQAFDYLARQYGSTDALKGAFVLNTPQDQILDKGIKGGSYYIARQNPITGKVSVETMDLGLPPEYTSTVDAGDRLLAIPDNWDGDPSKLISINKGLTPHDAAAGGGGGAAGYNGDFAATIDLAANANKSSPNVTKEAIRNQLQSYIAAGDYKSAYQGIVQQTRAGLDSTNAPRFDNALMLDSTLSDLQGALNDYANAGGKTNILTGTEDQIQTKIGQLQTDPKYAALAVRLDTAYQNYRLMLTGANFSSAEASAYASVLPSKSNTLELNTAKITGARAAANSTVEGSIRSVVGDGGINLKQYAEGAQPQGNTSSPAEGTDGTAYGYPGYHSDGTQWVAD